MRQRLKYIFGITLLISNPGFASQMGGSEHFFTMLHLGATLHVVSENQDGTVNVRIFGAAGDSVKALDVCDMFESLHEKKIKHVTNMGSDNQILWELDGPNGDIAYEVEDDQ